MYLIIMFITAANKTIDQNLNKIVAFTSVSAFIYLTNMPLTPKIIVFAIGYYSVLCHSTSFQMNYAINLLYNAHVGAKRINVNFLTDFFFSFDDYGQT